VKKVLALSAVLFVFLFVTGFQTTSQLASQLTTIQFQVANLKTQISGLEAQLAAKTIARRQFYLTNPSSYGANALFACAEGYHMASMSEILDPSNLRYNTELGRTEADSGFGPPANGGGWIRTGWLAYGGIAGGQSNCEAWTSSSVNHWGTNVTLYQFWNLPNPVSISPWVAGNSPCNVALPVWCVQD